MEFNLLQHPYMCLSQKHKTHHDNGKHPEKEMMMAVFNCANWFWFSFANPLPIPPLWLLFWLLVHFPLPIPPGFRLPEAESIRVCCQFSPELLHRTGAKHRQTSHAALANPPSLFSFPSLFFWFPRPIWGLRAGFEPGLNYLLHDIMHIHGPFPVSWLLFLSSLISLCLDAGSTKKILQNPVALVFGRKLLEVRCSSSSILSGFQLMQFDRFWANTIEYLGGKAVQERMGLAWVIMADTCYPSCFNMFQSWGT